MGDVWLLVGNIINVSTQIIVNPINAKGILTPWYGILIPVEGVSESLDRATNFNLGKEVKRRIKLTGTLSLSSVIITDAGRGLDCHKVVHTVTNTKPGASTSEMVIRSCLVNLLSFIRTTTYTDIAIPLIGSGTGKVNEDEVFNLILDTFKDTEFNCSIILTEGSYEYLKQNRGIPAYLKSKVSYLIEKGD